MIASLRALATAAEGLGRLLGLGAAARPADPETAALLAQAGEAHRAGQREEAQRLYHRVLDRRRGNAAALRGLRDLAIEAGAWRQALDAAERLVAALPSGERAGEAEWLAAMHYQLGQAEIDRDDSALAITHFKAALKADRAFVPAALALGDAYRRAGDDREALRTWERAAEVDPALPLLVRLEQTYRRDGRPTRMIALYRSAVERAPENLALGVALGRVYFELEMLDEAADQFQTLEVRAPHMPVVHAFLGAVFERRGAVREAFEEYRRAVRLAEGFTWPERCTACGATAPTWRDRCPRCGRWNTLHPAPAH
jgi:lipopolysaccharide biosynthesis regulator YciM